MKSLTIISGKGGTGKTTVAASFAAIAHKRGVKAVMADCDVDAADLHLILEPDIEREEIFEGGKLAVIDYDLCIECGKCMEHCRFDAISKQEDNGAKYVITPIDCEGCGVCEYVCPDDAITMKIRESGKWFISNTRFGAMVHARLAPGQGNSGMLVSIVRANAEDISVEQNLEYILIDGPPGMGCPVIASISGVDLVLVVTEPTLSAMHDMERIVGLATHFGVKATACINKYDINLKNTREIESYCNRNGVELLGKIPYDDYVIEALVQGIPVVEHPRAVASQKIETIWQRTLRILSN